MEIMYGYNKKGMGVQFGAFLFAIIWQTSKNQFPKKNNKKLHCVKQINFAKGHVKLIFLFLTFVKRERRDEEDEEGGGKKEKQVRLLFRRYLVPAWDEWLEAIFEAKSMREK